jgi:flagellar assembly protein FliH
LSRNTLSGTALSGTALSGTALSGTALSGNDAIVVRGDEAARAQRIDLVAPAGTDERGRHQTGLDPTGPWAAEARNVAAEARRQGYAAGHSEGREAGLAQGLAEARDHTAQLGGTLQQLGQRVELALADSAQRLAQDAATLALALAEAILDREVASSADPGAEAIARCLEMGPLTGAVMAHLHPDDLARLGPVAGLEHRELTVVPDPKLARGDAVVLVDDTMIDGRLAQALERAAQLLS